MDIHVRSFSKVVFHGSPANITVEQLQMSNIHVVTQEIQQTSMVRSVDDSN